MKKNKNIWYLFYPLFTFITVVFLYISYVSYDSVLQSNKTLTSSYNKILYNSLDTTLTQNEVLLDTLAQEILAFGLLKDLNKSKQLLQTALRNSKYVIGFALSDTKGNLLVTSANIDTNKVHNILVDDAVKTTFEKTLKSDTMVVGRTYFFPPLDSWLIPIRKAVRDEAGNVIGVMIAGLSNGKVKNLFSGIKLDDERRIILVQDFDQNNELYRLYVNDDSNVDYNMVYKTPLDHRAYTYFMQNIKKESGISNLEDLKDGNIYYSTTKDQKLKDIFLAVSYNQKYKIWVIVSQKKSFVYNQMLSNLVYILILYLFIVLMFYALFRTIVNKEKEKQKELIYKANHDVLTGHYNRNFIQSDESLIEKIKSKNFEVIFLDIDNFKNINDRFGHHVGDKVLIGISSRLNGYFDKEDIIIRQGGDEFIILSFSSIKIPELIEMFSKPCQIEDMEFRLGVSVGIAKYPDDSVHIDELFSMADIAMYEAKKVRNSYKYFNKEMYQKSIEKSDVEQQLRHALDNKEFYMVYQPQISKNGNIYGVEALLRWENAQLGFVPPGKFIPIAEDNGIIVRIGEWLIQRVLEDIKEVWEQTQQKFQISINISVIQFMEVGFLEMFLNILSKIGIDKTYITLEITESLAIEEFQYMIPLLNKVRENGIDISLDDFGTGYSSLSILNKLPISELKIDKQFVDDIEHDKDNSLIKTIFAIGKNFSFKIVCEGTETKEQVEILRDYGCDIFQGYYFSKPLTKDQLITFVKDRNV